MFWKDADEVLDAANLKHNVFTRNLVRTVYYGVYVIMYPVYLYKHYFNKK